MPDSRECFRLVPGSQNSTHVEFDSPGTPAYYGLILLAMSVHE